MVINLSHIIVYHVSRSASVYSTAERPTIIIKTSYIVLTKAARELTHKLPRHVNKRFTVLLKRFGYSTILRDNCIIYKHVATKQEKGSSSVCLCGVHHSNAEFGALQCCKIADKAFLAFSVKQVFAYCTGRNSFIVVIVTMESNCGISCKDGEIITKLFYI